MSVSVSTEQQFAKFVLSILVEETENAVTILENRSPRQRHKTVHLVRKSFKRIRGILRVVRDEVDWYHEENIFFRDTARKISELRDATSIINTLKLLHKQFSKELKVSTFDIVRKELLKQRRGITKECFRENDVLAEIQTELKPVVKRLKRRKLVLKNFDGVAQGISRVYERAYDAYTESLETKEVHTLHEWRKRVKYLRYQLEILVFIWPEYINTYINAYTLLGDLLGADHDLAVLSKTIGNDQFVEKISIKERELIQKLTNLQQNLLQDHAFIIGKRLFDPKDETFAGRIQTAWNTHSALESSKVIDLDKLEY